MHVTEIITINRSPEEVYSFWLNYQNYPRFMLDLESVRMVGPGLLHMKSKPDDGESAEWDTRITVEEPYSRIAWASVTGSIDYSGSARFEPATGGRGTVVRIEVDFTLPTVEAIKAKIAKLFGEDPAHRVKKTLIASKQILETGGITISEANIRSGHPAQPPADSEMELIAREYGRSYEAFSERQ
jgi:uncharacterized membrane protein